MKKRVLSILIVLVLLMNLLPVSFVNAASSRVTIKVIADKTEAKAGDEINYTITCETTENIGSIALTLDIPTGLNYVSNSGKLASDLRDKIGGITESSLDEADYTESSKMITIAHRSPFTLNGNVTLATFKCTVDNSASGNYGVGLQDVEVTVGQSFDIIPVDELSIVPATTLAVVSATGITLDKTTATVNAGATETITATIAPTTATNKKVNWESSDTTVATVSNAGVVTGVKPGSATITAVTEDGGFSATCNITVVCTHANKTTHPAVASTCKVQGNAEYETCDACGEVTSGSDAKLPLADHNYGTLIAKVDPIHTSTSLVDGKKAYYECSECHKLFGENKNEVTAEELVIKAPSHTYGDWTPSTTTTTHEKECACGNIITEPHKGGTATCQDKAKCEVCGAEYGNIDSSNHANTEVRDEIDATCTTDGYSGDVYCKDCNTKVETGKVVPAGHKGGIATCTKKAVCEVCGVEYGDIDSSNHFNKEIRNAVKATEETQGYTGDIYCSDCGTLVEKGEVIPVLEKSKVEENDESVAKTDSTKPQTDDNSHIMLWVSLLVISGICFVVIAKCKTKKEIIKNSK